MGREANANEIDILGVPVTPIGLSDAKATVSGWAIRREDRYVCLTGIHGLTAAAADRRVLEAHRGADLVLADGKPLVWRARMRGVVEARQVRGADLMRGILYDQAMGSLTHYIFGSSPASLERFVAAAVAVNPGLRLVGMESPPFREMSVAENASAVRRINDSGAHICWVALSTPKQELWMARNRGFIRGVQIGVGAAVDFIAGTQPEAPPRLQGTGFEWSYRMLRDPLRLGPRYGKAAARLLVAAAARRRSGIVDVHRR